MAVDVTSANMRVLQAVAALVLCAAAASATIVPVKGERKAADGTYVQRQKQILKLYIGLKQSEYFSNEYSDFNIKSIANQWTDPEYVNSFFFMYEHYYNLPKNGIFTLYEPQIRKFSFKLFDLFYFAKDFETFYKAASWAKKHVEPVMFNWAFTHALYHRADCQHFTVPPMYEVFPEYFVPQETIHQMYMSKAFGAKEAEFIYNNTGYEYNYNSNSYGSSLDFTYGNQFLDYKISYFREDVGLNNYYLAWMRKYPSWFTHEKYGKTWFKRGEGFYYTHQQLLARYNLERVANGLPFVSMFQWDKPVEIGYNPKVSHLGGQPFFPRPDNMIPSDSDNFYSHEAQTMEARVIDAIHYDGFWFSNNDTFYKFTEENGIDSIGKVIYGSTDFPSYKYYGSYFFKALQSLSNVAFFKNNFERNSGVVSCPFAALRDPLYYNFLARLVYTMQLHKHSLPQYTKHDLEFTGVTVQNVEFDKLMTYFEMSKFSTFNAIPVKANTEYKDLKYFARQFRLNHKPYNYKITVNSDATYDGIVRLFVGPKYDAEEHTLTFEQRRLAMFELDRFPVKISAGSNVFERNSKESPIFTHDKDGFRSMYEKLDKAATNSEPYYYYPEKVTCGFPDRFQLPKGWKNGQPFVFTVVVSPFTKHYEGEEKEFYLTCGSSKLYDYRPLGFPFDRPLQEEEFHVGNIYNKDVLIYHKDEVVKS